MYQGKYFDNFNGFKKIIIVDYDVVDVHNLNIQLMFSSADVGLPKTDCAKRNSAHHNIDST